MDLPLQRAESPSVYRKRQPRHPDPLAAGIRAGLRRAMAQMLIMEREALSSIVPGESANAARRARAGAYRKAYNELNRMLLWPDVRKPFRPKTHPAQIDRLNGEA